MATLDGYDELEIETIVRDYHSILPFWQVFAAQSDSVAIRFKNMDDGGPLDLIHAAIGISGEAGELLDAVKKFFIYGKALDIDNVVEECGDLLFYMQALFMKLGIDWKMVLTANNQKLEKRYPMGYSDQAAIERADKAE